MVELCQSPVDEAELNWADQRCLRQFRDDTHLPLFVVNHDVVWLDISVHDASRMTEVERFQQFQDVIPDIEICKFGVEDLEVGVVDVFEDD